MNNFSFGGEDTVYGDPYADADDVGWIQPSSDEKNAANNEKEARGGVTELMDHAALLALVQDQPTYPQPAAKKVSNSVVGPYASRFRAKSGQTISSAGVAPRSALQYSMATNAEQGTQKPSVQLAPTKIDSIPLAKHQYMIRKKDAEIVALQNELAAVQIHARNVADGVTSREKQAQQAYKARVRQVGHLEGDLRSLKRTNDKLLRENDDLRAEIKELKRKLRRDNVRNISRVRSKAAKPSDAHNASPTPAARNNISEVAVVKEKKRTAASKLAAAGKMQLNPAQQMVERAMKEIESPMHIVEKSFKKKRESAFSFDESPKKEKSRSFGLWLDEAESSNALSWDFASPVRK